MSWSRLGELARKSRAEPKIATGRRTQPAGGITRTTLSPYRSRTSDILATLRTYSEESQAIDFVKKVTPDVSMAVWNFVRLANQGHKIEFYAPGNKKQKLTEVEDKWRDEFAARVNEISNAGLDGLIDILHQSAFMKGAQGCEVEVTADRKDIVDVYPVVPQTIYWELGERDNRALWIPYQWQMGGKVSLEKGKANFFWVPTDPDIDDPRGNLILAPVLQSIDFQMQILQDLQAVLHHQGWPRQDVSINLERTLASVPAHIKSDPVKLEEWLTKNWSNIYTQLKTLLPDDDYLHYDDIEINMNQGANASRSLDVRAITEMIDTQTLSGAKQMAVFMNRNQGVTESWGSVQFKIFCSGIESIQRGSKRLVEEIARLWLRVNGIQAVPTFTHNTIDWQSEEQRMTVKLLEEKYWAIAQLMNWCDGNMAAQKAVGVEKAHGDTPSEGVKASFSVGGGDGGGKNAVSDPGAGRGQKPQKANGRAGGQIDL